MPHPRHRTKGFKDLLAGQPDLETTQTNPVSSVVAELNTHVNYALLKDKLAAIVTKWATSRMSANRLPDISEPPDPYKRSPTHQAPGTNTFEW